MKILYLTYDGLSDPLGQSQILPYLTGLADLGFDITIVSFEKKSSLVKLRTTIEKELVRHKIRWIFLHYTKSPPVWSTLYDLFRLRRTCLQLIKKNAFQIVHCRSYITSLVGVQLKKQFGLKFVFDMRGFYADERAESGLWNQRNFFYRLIYAFFKKKEKEFLLAADWTVVLTAAAKEVIPTLVSIDVNRLSIIPCCVDTNQFSPEGINAALRTEWKKRLAIADSDFVLLYLGAIGTWYLLDQMLDFFSLLKQRKPNAKFLFITHHSPNKIIESALQKRINKENLVVVKADRSEIPTLLSLSNLSIFFITPSFSKKASSPTKLAETLSMGIPIICNTSVGDTEQIMNASSAGYLIREFTTKAYNEAIDQLPSLMNKNKDEIRSYAINKLSLKVGIEKYNEIYKELSFHRD